MHGRWADGRTYEDRGRFNGGMNTTSPGLDGSRCGGHSCSRAASANGRSRSALPKTAPHARPPPCYGDYRAGPRRAPRRPLPPARAAQCTIILTRATALETIRDGITYPTTVKQAGRIVAFTVGLSASPAAGARASATSSSSTTSTAARPSSRSPCCAGGRQEAAPVEGRRREPAVPRPALSGRGGPVPADDHAPGPARRRDRAVHADLGAGALDRPLDKAVRLPPEPQVQLPASAGRLAGRRLTIGALARYSCDYPGTRVEYSATEVTSPATPRTTCTRGGSWHGRKR